MPLKELLKPIKIYRLIGLLMTYCHGDGPGKLFGWHAFLVRFWTGVAFLYCVLLGFDTMHGLQRVNDEKCQPEGISQAELKQIRPGLALIAATLMTVAFTIIVSWMIEGLLWQGLILLLMAIFTAWGCVDPQWDF